MAVIEVTNLKELLELTKENEPMREEIMAEELIRKYIRKKINSIISEQKKLQVIEEQRLRTAIRQILKEGDISDMHPHRSILLP